MCSYWLFSEGSENWTGDHRGDFPWLFSFCSLLRSITFPLESSSKPLTPCPIHASLCASSLSRIVAYFRARENNKEVSRPLVHSLNGQNGWCWPGWSQELGIPFRSLSGVAGAQAPGPFPAAFPGTLAGSWSTAEHWYGRCCYCEWLTNPVPLSAYPMCFCLLLFLSCF